MTLSIKAVRGHKVDKARKKHDIWMSEGRIVNKNILAEEDKRRRFDELNVREIASFVNSVLQCCRSRTRRFGS